MWRLPVATHCERYYSDSRRNDQGMPTVPMAMIRLLNSVPWFVITVFVASAALAIAAGRPSSNGAPSSLATRAVGIFYALAVTVVTALWAREQF